MSPYTPFAASRKLSSWAVTIRPSPEPPDRPTGLIASETHQAATLSWNDPGDASVTGYQILRRNKATTPVGGQYDVIQDDTSSAATTYVDTDVMPEGTGVPRPVIHLSVANH